MAYNCARQNSQKKMKIPNYSQKNHSFKIISEISETGNLLSGRWGVRFAAPCDSLEALRRRAGATCFDRANRANGAYRLFYFSCLDSGGSISYLLAWAFAY